MIKRSLTLGVLLLVSLASVVSAREATALVGGWKPMKDLNDPHVREIGEFAVSEYNKRSQAGLKFVSVVKGETQAVSGTNYRLVLAVKDGGVEKRYQAVVWEKPWLHYLNLTSFRALRV